MSRTTDRLGSKTKVIPTSHPAHGSGKGKFPKFRFPPHTRYHQGPGGSGVLPKVPRPAPTILASTDPVDTILDPTQPLPILIYPPDPSLNTELSGLHLDPEYLEARQLEESVDVERLVTLDPPAVLDEEHPPTTLFWVERQTGPGRWKREGNYTGSSGAELAETMASYYRKHFRRPTRIVEEEGKAN